MRRVYAIFVWPIALCVFLAGGLMGIFAAAGVVALVFEPAILDTALAKSPDRSHPAFWLFIGLMIPGMLVGFAGAVFGVLIPLFYFSGLRMGVGKQGADLDILRSYQRWLCGLIKREEQALVQAQPHDAVDGRS